MTASPHFPRNLLRAHVLGLSTCALGSLAAAQDADVFELDPIIVSGASGVEVDALTAPASVTILTAEDLKQRSATDLTEALRSVPGVTISGGTDSQDIYIRGFSPEYSLVLVDGVRLNTRGTRTNGASGVDPYFIPPVSAIERIEVIRGPMSSLHGSDAMGGVINIITKDSAPEWTGSITAEGTVSQHDPDGEQQQVSFYLNGPVVADRLALQLWGRRLHRDTSYREDGRDKRDLSDLRGRLTWTPENGHKFFADLGETKMTADPRQDGHRVLSFGHEGSWGAWDATSLLSYDEGGRETTGSDRNPEVADLTFDTSFSRDFDWNGLHQVTLGGQYRRAELSDLNPGLDDGTHYEFTNTQWALFAEDLWEVSPELTLTFGGRYTDDERFGGKFSPRIYAVWEMANDLYLAGGISTGYRTPELRESNENYYLTTNRGAAVIQGTPDLNAEESTSYEIGLRYEGDTTSGSATLFYTDFRNKIESRDTGNTITLNGSTYDLYEYYNVGRGRVQGLEMAGSWKVAPAVELSGTYTYTDSEQLTGANIGQPLSRTPDHNLSLRADWETPIAGLSAWGEVSYKGEQIHVTSRSVNTYDAFTTVDLGATYDLGNNLVIRGSIRNLTDKAVENDIHGTVLEGRTLWVSVTQSF